MDIVLAVTFAIFTWWLSTTVLLFLTRKNTTSSNISTMVLATFMLIAGLFILILSTKAADVSSAYMGFISVLLIWSWQEAGFLVGWFTGNRKSPCPKQIKGLKRAWLAFQTISYHEFILIILGFSIWMLTIDVPNDISLKTFLILWVMRLSAKLNVFFGVRNFYEEFLPKQISYLTTYFKRKSFNLFLPFLLFVAVITDMLFWYNAGVSTSSYERTSSALLAALLALGILEHIFMVLPFQLDRIWRLGLLKRT